MDRLQKEVVRLKGKLGGKVMVYWPRATVALAAVTLTALTLSACSSSKHAASSQPAGQAANGTSSVPTGAPIKIGVISTDAGPTGLNQDAPTVSKRWSDYINSHGGIAGHPVDVIEKSDGGSAATAVQDFEALQADGVVAIGDNSYLDVAFQKMADASHIPVIQMGNAVIPTPWDGSDPDFFPIGGAETVLSWVYGKMAQLTNSKKMGVVYCVEIAQCAQGEKQIAGATEKAGVKIVYQDSFSASAPNYTAQCLGAKDAGVNYFLVAGLTSASQLRVIDGCGTQGYYPTDVISASPPIAADKNIRLGVGFSAGTIPYFVQNSSTAVFDSVMGNYQSPIPQNVLNDWAALQVIALAAAHVTATPTSQEIRSGLYTFNKNTLGGLTVPLTYRSNQPNTSHCAFFYELKSGTYSTPVGLSPICQY